MPDPNEHPSIEIERQVLRFLCQGSGGGSLDGEVKAALRPYRWRERLHEVMFQILCELPADLPSLVREQLPARLTRHGFPDVAWESYFVPQDLAEEEVRRLVNRLLSSA
jgi:hypothetical protein